MIRLPGKFEREEKKARNHERMRFGLNVEMCG